MNGTVSAIIPAFNESPSIAATVAALASNGRVDEIIVVDDGSSDETFVEARRAGARVIRLAQNSGKANAVRTGFLHTRGDVILLVDADLRETAVAVPPLAEPVLDGAYDLSIGRLPGGIRKGGFGIVVTLAQWLVANEGGSHLQAPLSGQRAVQRKLLETLPYWGVGFGLEIALTLHSLRCGARITEIDIDAQHRVTGRDWPGFAHRWGQMLDILYTVWAMGLRKGRLLHTR